MLPFLKNIKHQAGVITEVRKPDGGAQEQPSDSDKDEGLRACSRDLIRAIKDDDEAGVTQALRSAFEIMDSEPHVEGKHINDDEGDSE